MKLPSQELQEPLLLSSLLYTHKQGSDSMLGAPAFPGTAMGIAQGSQSYSGAASQAHRSMPKFQDLPPADQTAIQQVTDTDHLLASLSLMPNLPVSGTRINWPAADDNQQVREQAAFMEARVHHALLQQQANTANQLAQHLQQMHDGNTQSLFSGGSPRNVPMLPCPAVDDRFLQQLGHSPTSTHRMTPMCAHTARDTMQQSSGQYAKQWSGHHAVTQHRHADMGTAANIMTDAGTDLHGSGSFAQPSERLPHTHHNPPKLMDSLFEELLGGGDDATPVADAGWTLGTEVLPDTAAHSDNMSQAACDLGTGSNCGWNGLTVDTHQLLHGSAVSGQQHYPQQHHQLPPLKTQQLGSDHLHLQLQQFMDTDAVNPFPSPLPGSSPVLLRRHQLRSPHPTSTGATSSSLARRSAPACPGLPSTQLFDHDLQLPEPGYFNRAPGSLRTYSVTSCDGSNNGGVSPNPQLGLLLQRLQLAQAQQQVLQQQQLLAGLCSPTAHHAYMVPGYANLTSPVNWSNTVTAQQPQGPGMAPPLGGHYSLTAVGSSAPGMAGGGQLNKHPRTLQRAPSAPSLMKNLQRSSVGRVGGAVGSSPPPPAPRARSSAGTNTWMHGAASPELAAHSGNSKALCGGSMALGTQEFREYWGDEAAPTGGHTTWLAAWAETDTASDVQGHSSDQQQSLDASASINTDSSDDLAKDQATADRVTDCKPGGLVSDMAGRKDQESVRCKLQRLLARPLGLLKASEPGSNDTNEGVSTGCWKSFKELRSASQPAVDDDSNKESSSDVSHSIRDTVKPQTPSSSEIVGTAAAGQQADSDTTDSINVTGLLTAVSTSSHTFNWNIKMPTGGVELTVPGNDEWYLPTPSTCRLFVGNIGWWVDESQLLEWFGPYGHVTDVQVGLQKTQRASVTAITLIGPGGGLCKVFLQFQAFL